MTALRSSCYKRIHVVHVHILLLLPWSPSRLRSPRVRDVPVFVTTHHHTQRLCSLDRFVGPGFVVYVRFEDSIMSIRHSVACVVFVFATVLVLRLSAQVAVRNQGFVPFSDAPIAYRGPVDDPVARLQRRIDRRDARSNTTRRTVTCRLCSGISRFPVLSQTLVYSKTSFQYKKISPQAPRALYFNDDVYVGRVHDGKALEFVSFDARQGAIFYMLDERQTEHPSFERAELDCTQCHVAAPTRNVPGVLIRSVVTSASGTQAARTPSFITGHQSPLKDRFGGWYITGKTRRTWATRRIRSYPTIIAAGNIDLSNRSLSHTAQRHRGASCPGPSDADAQPDHTDELSGAHRGGRPMRPTENALRPKSAGRGARALPAVCGRSAAR